jgi:hypothetical protein
MSSFILGLLKDALSSDQFIYIVAWQDYYDYWIKRMWKNVVINSFVRRYTGKSLKIPALQALDTGTDDDLTTSKGACYNKGLTIV